MTKTGSVHLVGAGPGDAGLLTLRGAELLRRADVVIYDLLVNPELLRLAPPTAELISRGRRQDVSQAELNALMIAKARDGKCVVRLKGGDPYIFGRGAEEAEALAAAKILFEVVPGVSSIAAVPNYAGIPLTHRDHTSNFTVFTGHEGDDKTESSLDFDQEGAGEFRQMRYAHQDYFRAGDTRDLVEVEAAFGFAVALVTGEDGEIGGVVAMCQRDARIVQHCRNGRNPRHHFEWNVCRRVFESGLRRSDVGSRSAW